MVGRFWDRGLEFECARCSACCTGAPGYVFLSRSDIRTLLSGLSLDFAAFFNDYCRVIDLGHSKAISLRETATYECVFWRASGCSVYPFRPLQCRTYPFWPGIVDTEADWAREARDCPGIGRGRAHPPEEIADCLWRDRADPRIRLQPTVTPESIDEDTVLGRSGIHPDADDAGTSA